MGKGMLTLVKKMGEFENVCLCFCALYLCLFEESHWSHPLSRIQKPHHIMTSKQTTIANDFCTVFICKAKNPAGATPLSHPALRALISKCFKVDFKSNDGSVAAELGKKFTITQAKNRAEAEAAKGVYSLRISGNGGAVKETVFGGLVLRKLPGISDAAKKTEA